MWLMIPSLRWLETLVISAFVILTDSVLTLAVIGKGKFADRVPKNLRNLLWAEPGCNNGIEFPFLFLALFFLKHNGNHKFIVFHFFAVTLLYECVLGVLIGIDIGYLGRHALKYAESKKFVEQDCFQVFYFVLALSCTGIANILATDDLLVAFAAGSAFSWDSWFAKKKTGTSHVSSVIDLLLNMSFFVYFGTIIPWSQFNIPNLGLTPW